MTQALTRIGGDNDTIRVEIVEDSVGLERLRVPWNKLYERASNAAPPLHHRWMSTWWEVYGPQYAASDRSLRILCFRRRGELVGLLPLYERRSVGLQAGGARWGFLSTGERERDESCPDYLDLLCLAEVRDICAELALGLLCGELSHRYDRLELSELADDSALVKAARARGAQYHLTIAPRSVCPQADLAGGFEAYLGRLSANTRQQSRRLLRGATQAGATFEVAQTPGEAMTFFDELVTLHQQRWQAAGEPGCFSSKLFIAFHRRLVEQWYGQGCLVLSRLRCGGQTLAVKYGFRNGLKYDFYQSGVRLDENAYVKSSGIVSFLLLMQYLCGEGVCIFDFLRGSSSYKYRLATSAQPLVVVRRVRWTWHSAVGLALNLSLRAGRRMRSVVMNRKKAGALSTRSRGQDHDE